MTDGHRRRADAILVRRTDRLPLNAPMNWESFEPVLRNAVDGDAVHLDVMPEDLRKCLADASQLAESLRLYDSQYHAELGWWTAPFEASEGIPYSALVSAAEGDRVDVGRAFRSPTTRRGARKSQKTVRRFCFCPPTATAALTRWSPGRHSLRSCLNARWPGWPLAR
ncbi:putative nAD(P)H nitroreductase acg [Mycobacterium xenopi 4042]|uniref:Putative nAD(P)H nitroreductase acg n=1 Tax=Mycobacterium xenopi 4042 TaxID=1299334 RepID=X8DY65_MYCXE|nr:putative nAD(P)H nitroreductase acg [Mycobacterium xenopi 4042]